MQRTRIPLPTLIRPGSKHADAPREGSIHPGWRETLDHAPPDLRRERMDLTLHRAEQVQQVKEDGSPGQRWLRSTVNSMNPRNWGVSSAVTGMGVASVAGHMAAGPLSLKAQKTYDKLVKDDPSLRWDPSKHPTPPAAWEKGFDSIVRNSGDKGLAQDGAVNVLTDASIKKRMSDGRQAPGTGRLGANMAEFGDTAKLDAQIRREAEAVAKGKGLPAGVDRAVRIHTDGGLPTLAHEVGHASGWQGLRHPDAVLGKIRQLAQKKHYANARGLGIVGSGYLAGKVVNSDKMDDREKAKALGGLALGTGALSAPGALELAEETRAVLRGHSLLKDLPTAQAAYRKLSIPSHGTYIASHLPGIAGTAILGGLAAHHYKKHYDKGLD